MNWLYLQAHPAFQDKEKERLAEYLSARNLRYSYPKLSEKYSSGGDSEPSNETSENLVEAYDFTVYDSEMNAVKLSEYFGKPIVINFWASWCGPCKSELPAFDAMYEKYGDEVVFMMINLTDGYNETVNGVKEFVFDGGYSFPVYYDTKYDAANTYGIYSIPETVFINTDGSIYHTQLGAMSEKVLENYIKQMIGEEK